MNKTESEEKSSELMKYRGLVLASIEYFLDNYGSLMQTPNLIQHFELLKVQTEEHYLKGRLSKLKQFFRDLTEPQIESRDIKLSSYLVEKTGYDIDILRRSMIRLKRFLKKE